MKTDIVPYVSVKALRNLPVVINRVVKRDCDLYWLNTSLSPRRLLLGLYVCYQNALKRNKDLANQIAYQRDHMIKLNEEINRLKEFEKMVIYEGYSAVITTHHWSCGDGCCSDSWAYYKIINQFGVVEEDTNDCCNSYRSADSIEQEIKKIYGDKITISHEDDYSDDEDSNEMY
jgi:hypothetical protein